MSKLQLKKELAQLDREQVVSLLLDLYSSRKEAKEWLDFFIDPNVERLYEKYRAEIEKELTRGKYGRSTARFSRIRKSIKEFSTFGVESESVIELMLYTLGLGIVVERRKYVSKTFLTGLAKLANDILTLADKACIFDSTHQKMTEILSGAVGSKNFVNYLRRQLDWSLL